MTVIAKDEFVLSAKNKTQKAFKSVEAGLGSVKSKLGGVQAKIAALVGVGGFGALVASGLKTGDQYGKLADRIDVSTRAMAAWDHQAQLTGTNGDSVRASVERMTKRIGEAAQGFGAAKKQLERLGLSAQELAHMGADEAYKKIADAIAGLDTQADKAATTAAIFGREGLAMINMIEQGAEGFNAAAAEADQFGLSISRVEAAKIEAANDAMLRVKQSVRGVGTALAVQLSPYIEAAAKWFVEAGQRAGGFSNLAKSGVGKLATAIGWVADALQFAERAWVGFQWFANQAIANALTSLDWLQKGIIDALNVIPGVNIARDNGLTMLAEVMAFRAKELRQELVNLADAPAWSEKVEAGIKAIGDAADKAAQQVADIQARKGSAPPALAPEDDEKTRKAAEKQRAALEKSVSQVEASLFTENERLQAAYENRAQIVNTAYENGLIDYARFSQLHAGLADQHQQKLAEIEARGQSAQEKMWRSGWQGKANVVADVLGNVGQLMASENKKQFEIGKKAAIGQTIIATITSAQEAYKALAGIPIIGPALGAAAAAAATLAGYARVKAIKSTSFGGAGSGAVGNSGSGVTAGAQGPITGTAAPVADAQAQAKPQTVVKVEIMGNVISQADWVQNELVPEIRRAVDDNDALLFSDQSAQAELLAG